MNQHPIFWNRRSFLAGTTSVSALLLSQEVEARNGGMRGGVVAAGGGGSSLLKTVTLLNTSGSATATNSHTPSMGLLFKKGNVPTGTYPILKTSGGTIVPYTYWNETRWSDGSLKLLPVLPRFPAAISGSGSASLQVWSGGSAQSASSRTLAEIYAENITVVGVALSTNPENITGTWTCDLQAANILETVVYGDGPAGKVYRFLCNFNQSGSPHGQLVTYFYLMQLQDAAGNLAGWRVLPRVTQPWYNYDTPAKYHRVFASLTLQYGAGPTTVDPMANLPTRTFSHTYAGATFTASINGGTRIMTVTAVSSGTINVGDYLTGAGIVALDCPSIAPYGDNGTTGVGGTGTYSLYGVAPTLGSQTINCGDTWLASTAHGYTNGVAVRLTTTGTLPTGLSLNTTYYIQTDEFNANRVFLIDAAAGGYSHIAVLGAGSGTHTFNPIPYVCHFGAYWVATDQGKYVYFQGSGSVATEPTILVQADKTYDRATKVLPPFKLDVTPTGNSSSNPNNAWTPYNASSFGTSWNGGGDGPGFKGVLSDEQCRHFYLQTQLDERVTRIIGLYRGALPFCFKDRTTKQYVNLSASSYTGLPASTTTLFWNNGNNGSGWTIPGGYYGNWTQGPVQLDTSHMPSFSAYPYIATGEPQYQDLNKEAALGVIIVKQSGLGNYARDYTTNGHNYYGIAPAGGRTLRESAWSLRDIVWAAALAPDNDPDGSQYSQYQRAFAANQATYMVDYTSTLSAWAQTNGFWYPQAANGGGSKKCSWQDSYLGNTIALHACALEDTNAFTMLTHVCTWQAYLRNTTGSTFNGTTYHELSCSNANEEGGYPLITDFDHWGASPQNSGGLSWNSGTQLFTWTTPNWTPTNGDKILFNQTAYLPGGFSTMTPYYAVSTSGNTFKLSATVGGSPITITNTANSGYNETLWVVPIAPPATGSIGLSIGPVAGPAQTNSFVKWGLAAGVSVSGLSTVASEYDTSLAGVDWTQSVKYHTQSTF